MPYQYFYSKLKKFGLKQTFIFSLAYCFLKSWRIKIGISRFFFSFVADFNLK